MTVMFIRITKVSAAKIVESISILYASISINRENDTFMFRPISIIEVFHFNDIKLRKKDYNFVSAVVF